MKILITGGTGLVGSEIGKSLARQGHDLVLISRNPDESRKQSPYPGEFMSWQDFMDRPLGDIDAVIHLAGESIASGVWTKSRRKKILDSRVNSTRNLVEAFKKINSCPKVWINASAMGYYGDAGDVVLTESSPKGAGFLADVCAAWEAELQRIPASCRVVIARTSMVLAPRGGALGAMLPAFRAGLGATLGSGEQWMSWIHLSDLVRLIEFALTNEQLRGPVNACAPHPIQNKDFTKSLLKVLNRREVLGVPKGLLAMAGEMSSLFLDSQRMSAEKIQSLGFKFEFSTMEAAFKSLLDYQSRWGVHEMFQEQWVPHKIEEIFPFFSDAKNLEQITPPTLGFKVEKMNTPEIENGTLIDYNLKIHGVPVKWRTQILEWEPNKKFVDTQLKGPYELWHHTHEFEALANGTLMRDRVLYKLPIWPFGNFMLPFIQKDVQSIFKFRRGVIAKKFG